MPRCGRYHDIIYGILAEWLEVDATVPSLLRRNELQCWLCLEREVETYVFATVLVTALRFTLVRLLQRAIHEHQQHLCSGRKRLDHCVQASLPVCGGHGPSLPLRYRPDDYISVCRALLLRFWASAGDLCLFFAVPDGSCCPASFGAGALVDEYLMGGFCAYLLSSARGVMFQPAQTLAGWISCRYNPCSPNCLPWLRFMAHEMVS